MCLPTVVEDEQVSMLANLQRAVGVGAAQGVGGVDGGGGQSLRHAHPHVDAGQVHDDGLRGGKWTHQGMEQRYPSCTCLTMEQQKALGLKSLPRATMTPASSMALARGCGSLDGQKDGHVLIKYIKKCVCVCDW